MGGRVANLLEPSLDREAGGGEARRLWGQEDIATWIGWSRPCACIFDGVGWVDAEGPAQPFEVREGHRVLPALHAGKHGVTDVRATAHLHQGEMGCLSVGAEDASHRCLQGCFQALHAGGGWPKVTERVNGFFRGRKKSWRVGARRGTPFAKSKQFALDTTRPRP